MIPRWLDRLWAASTGRFGIIVVAVIAVTALVSLLWTPFDPQASTSAIAGCHRAGRTSSARTTPDATS